MLFTTLPIPPLFAFVLAWMTSLTPQRAPETLAPLAWAIATQAETPVEAALLTSIAYRESTFQNEAIGDAGRSVCALQLMGATRAMTLDPMACVREGLRRLRESRRIDAANPVAFYAAGNAWRTVRAQRISRDRVALARRLLSSKVPELD